MKPENTVIWYHGFGPAYRETHQTNEPSQFLPNDDTRRALFSEAYGKRGVGVAMIDGGSANNTHDFQAGTFRDVNGTAP